MSAQINWKDQYEALFKSIKDRVGFYLGRYYNGVSFSKAEIFNDLNIILNRYSQIKESKVITKQIILRSADGLESKSIIVPIEIYSYYTTCNNFDNESIPYLNYDSVLVTRELNFKLRAYTFKGYKRNNIEIFEEVI